MKKQIITIVGLFLGLLILYILLSTFKNTDTKNKIELLNDEKRFFEIQKSLNNYIEDTQIYDYSMYTTKSIHYVENNNTFYYFINGYFIEIKDDEEEFKFNKNVNYLLTLKGNTYIVSQIDSDITEYMNQFEYNIDKIKEGYFLPNIDYSEKTKLVYYVNNIITLYNYDSSSLNNYILSYDEKIQTLSTQIISYTKDITNNDTVYTIIDSNNNRITLKETSLMNYTVTNISWGE